MLYHTIGPIGTSITCVAANIIVNGLCATKNIAIAVIHATIGFIAMTGAIQSMTVALGTVLRVDLVAGHPAHKDLVYPQNAISAATTTVAAALGILATRMMTDDHKMQRERIVMIVSVVDVIIVSIDQVNAIATIAIIIIVDERHRLRHDLALDHRLLLRCELRLQHSRQNSPGVLPHPIQTVASLLALRHHQPTPPYRRRQLDGAKR